jgi:predicted GTPase
LLNEGQRGRVLNTLFSIQELRESDMELVELVRGLDDKRLLPYLVAQLHRLVPEAPELAERLVTAVAEILEDEAIEKAADHYCENADYSQDEEQEEEDNNSQKAQTPSVGAQVATARRSAMLTQFIALAEQKLHR